MVDNFDLILNILPDKPVDDLQYFCQILKRKKDHSELTGSNNSARLIRAYYFTCKNDMIRCKNEMIKISEAVGARIMMDCFPKSKNKIKYEMMIRLAQIIRDGNDAKLHRLYNTCYGSTKAEKKHSLWLIDWDFKNIDILDKCINEVNKEGKAKIEVVYVIPTRQGYHYITRPFYSKILMDKLQTYGIKPPAIHKNSPTLVYFPESLNLN